MNDDQAAVRDVLAKSLLTHFTSSIIDTLGIKNLTQLNAISEAQLDSIGMQMLGQIRLKRVLKTVIDEREAEVRISQLTKLVERHLADDIDAGSSAGEIIDVRNGCESYDPTSRDRKSSLSGYNRQLSKARRYMPQYMLDGDGDSTDYVQTVNTSGLCKPRSGSIDVTSCTSSTNGSVYRTRSLRQPAAPLPMLQSIRTSDNVDSEKPLVILTITKSPNFSPTNTPTQLPCEPITLPIVNGNNNYLSTTDNKVRTLTRTKSSSHDVPHLTSITAGRHEQHTGSGVAPLANFDDVAAFVASCDIDNDDENQSKMHISASKTLQINHSLPSQLISCDETNGDLFNNDNKILTNSTHRVSSPVCLLSENSRSIFSENKGVYQPSSHPTFNSVKTRESDNIGKDTMPISTVVNTNAVSIINSCSMDSRQLQQATVDSQSSDITTDVSDVSICRSTSHSLEESNKSKIDIAWSSGEKHDAPHTMTKFCVLPPSQKPIITSLSNKSSSLKPGNMDYQTKPISSKLLASESIITKQNIDIAFQKENVDVGNNSINESYNSVKTHVIEKPVIAPISLVSLKSGNGGFSSGLVSRLHSMNNASKSVSSSSSRQSVMPQNVVDKRHHHSKKIVDKKTTENELDSTSPRSSYISTCNSIQSSSSASACDERSKDVTIQTINNCSVSMITSTQNTEILNQSMTVSKTADNTYFTNNDFDFSSSSCSSRTHPSAEVSSFSSMSQGSTQVSRGDKLEKYGSCRLRQKCNDVMLDNTPSVAHNNTVTADDKFNFMMLFESAALTPDHDNNLATTFLSTPSRHSGMSVQFSNDCPTRNTNNASYHSNKAESRNSASYITTTDESSSFNINSSSSGDFSHSNVKLGSSLSSPDGLKDNNTIARDKSTASKGVRKSLFQYIGRPNSKLPKGDDLPANARQEKVRSFIRDKLHKSDRRDTKSKTIKIKKNAESEKIVDISRPYNAMHVAHIDIQMSNCLGKDGAPAATPLEESPFIQAVPLKNVQQSDSGVVYTNPRSGSLDTLLKDFEDLVYSKSSSTDSLNDVVEMLNQKLTTLRDNSKNNYDK